MTQHRQVNEAVRAPATPAGKAISRTHTVWGAFIVAMTAVGGLLIATEPPALPPPVLAEADRPATDLSVILEAMGERRYPWSGIVIHHSGANSGDASTIAAAHRAQGLHGLGYHFVIGNGGGALDGEIEVGRRWLEQIAGAHTTGPNADAFNRTTIGICLVGDGEQRAFSDAQLAALFDLLELLQQEFAIADDRVFLHRDIAATASPGRLFPEAALRARLAKDR